MWMQPIPMSAEKFQGQSLLGLVSLDRKELWKLTVPFVLLSMQLKNIKEGTQALLQAQDPAESNLCSPQFWLPQLETPIMLAFRLSLSLSFTRVCYFGLTCQQTYILLPLHKCGTGDVNLLQTLKSGSFIIT